MQITTPNDVPGDRIEDVSGTTARRRAGSHPGAARAATTGGVVRRLGRNLGQSRPKALGRLAGAAAAQGVDTVVALRFDVTETEGMRSEICALGTACRPTRLRVPGPATPR
jgi:uncharacterized protein YbjQ (UPF0145 family)